MVTKVYIILTLRNYLSTSFDIPYSIFRNTKTFLLKSNPLPFLFQAFQPHNLEFFTREASWNWSIADENPTIQNIKQHQHLSFSLSLAYFSPINILCMFIRPIPRLGHREVEEGRLKIADCARGVIWNCVSRYPIKG